MTERPEQGEVLVQYLECGATRLVPPKEPGMCPVCDYQGWAYPEDLATKDTHSGSPTGSAT
jgi:hypothetical protein